jgi:hypothetical protein
MRTDLENLTKEFNGWRERVGRGRVPKQLKQKVIDLCRHHAAEELASALGLKTKTVQQWQRRATLTLKKSRIDPVDFVALSSPKSTQAKHCRETPTLTLELSNGIKLILKSGQTTTELLELTTDLAKRLSA